jgi:hypothetical protein
MFEYCEFSDHPLYCNCTFESNMLSGQEIYNSLNSSHLFILFQRLLVPPEDISSSYSYRACARSLITPDGLICLLSPSNSHGDLVHHSSLLLHLPMWIDSSYFLPSCLHVLHLPSTLLAIDEIDSRVFHKFHTASKLVHEIIGLQIGKVIIKVRGSKDKISSIVEACSNYFWCHVSYDSATLIWSLQSSLSWLHYLQSLCEHVLLVGVNWSIS